LLRGGGSGGGIEESAFFGGKGGLTVGTIQSSAYESDKFFCYLHRGHFYTGKYFSGMIHSFRVPMIHVIAG
jgi:hypothetical protein